MKDLLEIRMGLLPTNEGQLHLLLPAGIGDTLWVASKWWSIWKERDVILWFPQAEQKRSGALAQMLGVRYGYLPDLTTKYVWAQPGEPDIPDSGGVLIVQPNRHLEAGKRIERWYPELPFKVPELDIKARLYKQEAGNPKYVVAFMCHNGYMEGNLLPAQWARLFQEIEGGIAPVLLIGAEDDCRYMEKVLDFFDPTVAPIMNAPLDQVAAVLQGAAGVIGVASGITILATYLGVPTLHAYPRWLKNMPDTWPHQEAIYSWCHVDELPLPSIVGSLSSLISSGSVRRVTETPKRFELSETPVVTGSQEIERRLAQKASRNGGATEPEMAIAST